MNRKGVVYETGRIVDGRSWRPEFDPAEARRELAIIRDDLHCNAVRITGDDIGRVTAVAADALEQGLEPGCRRMCGTRTGMPPWTTSPKPPAARANCTGSGRAGSFSSWPAS
jgi:hypothetical protein